MTPLVCVCVCVCVFFFPSRTCERSESCASFLWIDYVGRIHMSLSFGLFCPLSLAAVA